MRIVYCMNHLCADGGISVATITKANALADIDGYEIFIIITDGIDEKSLAILSAKINLIDLNVRYYEYDWKSKYHLIKTHIVKGHRHRNRLGKTLGDINPDIVISVGQSEKYILPSIKGRWKLIREIHYASDYRRLMASRLKFTAYLKEFYDYKWKSREYDKIVVLTHDDYRRNWKNNNKISVVPNPLSYQDREVSLLCNRKIISIGRLVKEKNFLSLIQAFQIVSEIHDDWTLEIYGEGSERSVIEDYILKNGLQDKVFLKGKTENSGKVLSEASIFCLSSDFEGFGLVIVEAMACGIPVVTYACPSGPKEIVTNGRDGFLVEPRNYRVFAEKICDLIENVEKRKSMGQAALEKSKDYSIGNIIPKWIELFNNMMS